MTNPARLPRIRKSPLMEQVEAMFFGLDIRLVLIDLYDQLGSQVAIARRLGLSAQTIVTWFRLLGLTVRQRNEALLDPAVGARKPQAEN